MSKCALWTNPSVIVKIIIFTSENAKKHQGKILGYVLVIFEMLILNVYLCVEKGKQYFDDGLNMQYKNIERSNSTRNI